MSIRDNEQLLSKLVADLDLPGSAYEAAVRRYENIGEWLGREDSSCADFDPHIFPQGSFRLGIAIKPLSGLEEYDLDLACNLRSGVDSNTHTQKNLKELVGAELELYRNARNIRQPLEAKHRCWRLEYADNLRFHMDIVPCVPESEIRKKSLVVAMESYGVVESLAQRVAELALGITDDRHPNYSQKVSDWLISNPEGYAQWFESNMHPTEWSMVACESAQVDEVPMYKTKTPLQRIVQILKRHRDKMFADNPDSKPISVIITTLAASEYSGGSSLESALKEVLQGLKEFIKSDSNEVLNPVNPNENFADRWSMPAYKNLELKKNFHNWVNQVNRDFEFLLGSNELEMISESLAKNLSISLESQKLASLLSIPFASEAIASQPKVVSEPVSKPWSKGRGDFCK
ncbi:nucleotidyltransferase domain-containing protein [Pectobacterium versatile]|uniref:nucleotidyltransferase domain-containing protein n=1 Tax=Pectobacterium versatile TaxID=2488639 RepID=UPI001CF0E464|nr:nucleotidyltransferase [Pectobacterium versatile]MCA6925982.1 nucleotidyltransferase [Pectobacterium versatile]MCH5082736.1 nucleotidyltransferase [Pectobacterium versatile]